MYVITDGNVTLRYEDDERDAADVYLKFHKEATMRWEEGWPKYRVKYLVTQGLHKGLIFNAFTLDEPEARAKIVELRQKQADINDAGMEEYLYWMEKVDG